ncbi:ADP-ribosyltransferase [Streptomyces sp. NPDC093109]|uniref:ADP-ribosyltransferase n=1 Tax=Streptomyces sp. NPDC093109 TaxID=3154977 RepID=UPI00344FA3C9
MRRQDGQGTIEYVGIVLVGVLIISLLVSSGVGSSVSAGALRAVKCVVAASSGCDGGEDGDGGDGGGAGDGRDAVAAGNPPGRNSPVGDGSESDGETEGGPKFSQKRRIPNFFREDPTLGPEPASTVEPTKVLCEHGSLPVGDHCQANPLLFAGTETEAEMFVAAAKAAEEAEELSENIITAESWLYNIELLEAFRDGVGTDENGNPIAKRGLLLTAPFVAMLGPQALLALAALAVGILAWHLLSGNNTEPPPPAQTSPLESGFASSTLLWTAPHATPTGTTVPAPPLWLAPVPTHTVAPEARHALDEIPTYRAGPVARRDWATEVARIAAANPLTENLTADDALAVADYTGSWALDLNNYLRGRETGASRGDQLSDRVERMDRALRHLPPVEGTVYRGTFMPDDVIRRLAAGEQVGMPEYLSTSTDVARAERGVLQANGRGAAGERVLLRIETNNGRNIDPLSRYRGVESEILIPRGGTFEQTGTETTRIDGKEYKVIVMRQTG